MSKLWPVTLRQHPVESPRSSPSENSAIFLEGIPTWVCLEGKFVRGKMPGGYLGSG